MGGLSKLPASKRMVKIKCASRISGLTKRLFGYGSWPTKVGTKVYQHKPIIGRLQGLPVKRAGRATLIAPQELLPQVKAAIDEAGGVIRSVTPIIMNEEETKNMVDDVYNKFVRIIITALHYASEAHDKEVYISALEKAIMLTRRFESLINGLSEYPLYKEESQIMRTLEGLKSLADQDIEAVKMQAESLAIDLEEQYKARFSSK